jgi:transposase-like protein
LEPANATHRQYEALRAYFVEGVASKEAARRFGYTPGSFRTLVHQFRRDPQRAFFRPPQEPPAADARRGELRQRVIALRKQNLSIYDISRTLEHEGLTLSPVAGNNILKEEGFARLPRRLDEERPPGTRPTRAEVADVRQLDLTPRQFRTRFGGLFLFLPALVACGLDAVLRTARFPGTVLIPAGCAVRALLALTRISHRGACAMAPELA